MPGRQHWWVTAGTVFLLIFCVGSIYRDHERRFAGGQVFHTCQRLLSKAGITSNKKELPGEILEVRLPGGLASVAAYQDEKPTTLIISKNKFFYKYLHLI